MVRDGPTCRCGEGLGMGSCSGVIMYIVGPTNKVSLWSCSRMTGDMLNWGHGRITWEMVSWGHGRITWEMVSWGHDRITWDMESWGHGRTSVQEHNGASG